MMKMIKKILMAPFILIGLGFDIAVTIIVAASLYCVMLFRFLLVTQIDRLTETEHSQDYKENFVCSMVHNLANIVGGASKYYCGCIRFTGLKYKIK